MSAAELARRFQERLESEGPAAGSRVVVAFSGGLDSTVLLHLLRFGVPGRHDLIAAHLDHAIRPESADDADWARGLCRAWGVPCTVRRLSAAPASEAAGRRLRYAYLEDVAQREAATAIVTAHHADDQAETVLFRVLRGTGVDGLTGIPPRRGVVHRPLLGFWRDELRAYADRARLSWRKDATNDATTYSRNAIRHEILPAAERLVAPASRRALVRLARVAHEEAAAWNVMLDTLLAPLEVEGRDEGLTFRREPFLLQHPAVQARVLRTLASRVGVRLDERGTRLAVAFSGEGPSGRGIELGGGIRLQRQLERLALVRPPRAEPDSPVRIEGFGPGRAEGRLGGRTISVEWGAPVGDAVARETIAVGERTFPIVVRGRRPGDRIRLQGGTKKLKKLFLEARIPPDRRSQVPVVANADGDVLWVAGIARSEGVVGVHRGSTLEIGIG